jgi:lipid-binding SYLF domain-containing protein
MKQKFACWMALAVLFFCLVPATSVMAGKAQDKVAKAAAVMEKIMAIPESAIPPSLLRNAHGIAIIPGVIKAGFVIGGRYGTGVVLVRNAAGNWSNPCMVSLAGGSVGWQVGAQSTDVILVFKSARSIEGMIKGKYTLGVDAAVAAGPVGRRVEGATDIALKAEILSYSRSRGFFAGVSLEGSALQIDDEANASYYQQSYVRANDVLYGPVSAAPPAADRLREILAIYSTPPAR